MPEEVREGGREKGKEMRRMVNIKYDYIYILQSLLPFSTAPKRTRISLFVSTFFT